MKTLLILASLLLAVSCDSGSGSNKKPSATVKESQEEIISEKVDLGLYDKSIQGIRCEIAGLDEPKEVFIHLKPSIHEGETEMRMYNLNENNTVEIGFVEFGSNRTLGLHQLKKLSDGTFKSGDSYLGHKEESTDEKKSSASYTSFVKFESDFSAGVIYSRKLYMSQEPKLVDEKLEMARFERCEETTVLSMVNL